MEQPALPESVAIGKQVWTTRNLNVDVFRNGERIPVANSEEEWLAASQEKTPMCCYMDFNSAHAGRYGRLYNWHAVNDPRGLAPAGWHVPTYNEWLEMRQVLGNSEQGRKMKSDGEWPGRGGTNESGLSALPGGGATYGGGFIFLGSYGFWWSATKQGHEGAYALCLASNTDAAILKDLDVSLGHSIRCVKDA